MEVILHISSFKSLLSHSLLIYVQRHKQVDKQKDTDIKSYMHVIWSSRVWLDWARAQGFPGCTDDCIATSLLIVADFGGRYQDSGFWKIHQLSKRFLCTGFIVPSFVTDLYVTRAAVQAQGSHLYFHGDSPKAYRVSVYYVLKSLFTVQDGDDVWGLWIR